MQKYQIRIRMRKSSIARSNHWSFVQNGENKEFAMGGYSAYGKHGRKLALFDSERQASDVISKHFDTEKYETRIELV